MTIIIVPENANRRLDKFLFAYLNNAPHSFIYKMLRKKRIKLNGGRAQGNELLQNGDELRFFISEDTLAGCRKTRSFAPAKPLCGIIFEDDNLLIVNKPAGLPSHGGMAAQDHLLARMLYYLQENGTFGVDADFTPALCNRLDVNTSGLVVCGKNLHTLQKMNLLFASREVQKEYITIVHGVAGEIGKRRTLRDFYEKDEKANKAHITREQQDDEIITDFTVLAVTSGYSLLSVSPITGRSHQIRVHLASAGFPIIGDKKYGGKSTPFAAVQLLHCRKLQLPCGMAWESPLPTKFLDCINKLFGGNVAICKQ